eukprot:COSAG03_NODE_27043_length_255_cov_1.256410_2_plen_56_part_01
MTTAVVASLLKRFCMLTAKNGTERPNKMSKMFDPAPHTHTHRHTHTHTHTHTHKHT